MSPGISQYSRVLSLNFTSADSSYSVTATSFVAANAEIPVPTAAMERLPIKTAESTVRPAFFHLFRLIGFPPSMSITISSQKRNNVSLTFSFQIRQSGGNFYPWLPPPKAGSPAERSAFRLTASRPGSGRLLQALQGSAFNVQSFNLRQ